VSTTWLLDTHTWLWSVREPFRLGPETTRVLEQPGARLALSSASVWEASMLIERGRVREVSDRTARVKRWRNVVPAVEVPVDDAIALRAGRLEWSHRDPADRFIVACALERGYTVLTADARILGYADVPSFDARR
jgi:PIN domain nuclease of toxin-antitoxin system